MKDDHVMMKSDSKLLLRQTIIVSFSLLTFFNVHLPLIVLNSDTLFGVQIVTVVLFSF